MVDFLHMYIILSLELGPPSVRYTAMVRHVMHARPHSAIYCNAMSCYATLDRVSTSVPWRNTRKAGS